MLIVLQLPLCMYGLQGSVVYVDDYFLPHNVMLYLMVGLHNGIHFLFKWDNFRVCTRVSHYGKPLNSHAE